MKLGESGRDVVTGFEGVATGRAEYLSGCTQVLLVPKVGSDGAFREGQWFDESRIVVGSNPPVQLNRLAVKETPGPDRPAPKGW